MALLCIPALLFSACRPQEEIKNVYEQQTQFPKQEIIFMPAETEEARTITVTGVGSKNTDPDVAKVGFSVHASAEAAEEAQALTSERMKEVLAALREKGVRESEITQEVVITPTQNNRQPPEIIGYGATNTVSVRMRDVHRLGELIEAATAAGATMVMPIEFYLVDERAAYEEALAAAVENAYIKAGIVAEQGGLELDGPGVVEEKYEILKNAPEVLLYDGYVAPPLSEEEEGETAIDSTTLIQAGQLTVTAEVEVTFRVKWPTEK